MATETQARETRKAGTLADRIRFYLTTTDHSAEEIASILSSDVNRQKSIARQTYAIQRELRAAAAVDPRETYSHQIAELRERVATLERTVAELRGLPVDPIARRLVQG